MKKIKSIFYAVLALTFLYPNASVAENFRLLTHKAWIVELRDFDQGDLYCVAETRNRYGETFSLATYSSGTKLFFFLGPNHWKHDFNDDLQVDIDYSEWTLNRAQFYTKGQTNYVVFEFSSSDKFLTFLEQVYDGSAIAMKSPDRSRTIAVWSLAGSAAALLKLNECRDRVRGQSGDSYYGASESYGERY